MALLDTLSRWGRVCPKKEAASRRGRVDSETPPATTLTPPTGANSDNRVGERGGRSRERDAGGVSAMSTIGVKG